MPAEEMRKPKWSMKVVIKWGEMCMTHKDCTQCHYRKLLHCREALMADMLYYLRMALEKSRKGQHDAAA